MLKRLMFVPAFIFIFGCEPSALDLASFDAADISLDEADPDACQEAWTPEAPEQCSGLVDPVAALAWCQGSVENQDPETNPSISMDGLNGLEGDLDLNQNRIGEWCDPSARYLFRHETCVGCDGVCIGVEWPLGARTGHYAFACVSAAELASSPDALEGRKTSLCRQAGTLFSYCDFMSAQGWREIYYNERQCVIGPAL